MLEVQLLEAGAKAPVVGHPGEDLGYDVFALEDVELKYGVVTVVRTGIAVAAFETVPVVIKAGWGGIPRAVVHKQGRPLGLLIRDRSSMAVKGITTSGGVIDAGYRGEIKILMTDNVKRLVSFDGPAPYDAPGQRTVPYQIKAGEKIAQMVPQPILTGTVSVVDKLQDASRGDAGFGSTGK